MFSSCVDSILRGVLILTKHEYRKISLAVSVPGLSSMGCVSMMQASHLQQTISITVGRCTAGSQCGQTKCKMCPIFQTKHFFSKPSIHVKQTGWLCVRFACTFSIKIGVVIRSSAKLYSDPNCARMGETQNAREKRSGVRSSAGNVRAWPWICFNEKVHLHASTQETDVARVCTYNHVVYIPFKQLQKESIPNGNKYIQYKSRTTITQQANPPKKHNEQWMHKQNGKR